MKVCYFGTYDPIYTRNRLMIKGLRQNGVEVIFCRTPQTKNKLKKYWQLIKLHRRIKKEYDIMVVGFAGHAIMPLAWFLARLNRKKIVFDVFVSEYDSLVLDRKTYSHFSLYAFKYWFLDWFSCVLADEILLDADEHIKFFVKTFGIKKEKFKRIFVSCDNEIFYPRPKENNDKEFLVHYHGSYSPIQGVKYIVQAAKLLAKENIKFNIIGKLKNHQKEIELSQKLNLNNINFIDFMSYEKLADNIALADICLGMFGDTKKAMHCGAFKIIEAMAMKKAVVTGETPALREYLSDSDCLFCRMADSSDLAEKILELKNNIELREKIAENGYQTYLKYFTPQTTAAELIKILAELLIKK